MDEQLTSDGVSAEQFAGTVDDGQLYAEYRRLATEQDAVRRVATLVAQGVEPSTVFGAVAEEMRRCVPAVAAGVGRFDADGDFTLLAVALHPAGSARLPVGSRTPLEGNTLAPVVQRTGGSARVDAYENAAGPIAARLRAIGLSASVGVPIIVDGRVWGVAAVASVEPGPMPADTEVRIGRFAELITTALVAGDRDEQRRQLMAEASRRANLIDAVLEGRAFGGERSGWQVAGHLGLPLTGPFVVVAAPIPAMGDEPLPGIESKLRSRDIFSAWRLLPDVQVGIVYVASDRQFRACLALMSRVTTARVGVSARFDDLRDTPRALHVARVMLRGRAEPSSSVAVFDGSILATAAVSAPEAMIKIVGPTLEGFSRLSNEEREILLETFRTWLDNGASVSAVAKLLFCHPNTVRYRLRRIERLTGRSLSRPRDAAELSLAFEVHRRFM
jgi:PucR C-terminal helix-turn-helix domain/GGDEF-like domain/GAF domain